VNPLATAEKEIRALARRLGIRSHLVRAALESISEDDPVPAKLAKATRAARPATANDMGQAARVEKFTYVRSRPLCKAFRLIPCQNCSAQDGSVVGATRTGHVTARAEASRQVTSTKQACASPAIPCLTKAPACWSASAN
jgi:hypothetical protein